MSCKCNFDNTGGTHEYSCPEHPDRSRVRNVPVDLDPDGMMAEIKRLQATIDRQERELCVAETFYREQTEDLNQLQATIKTQSEEIKRLEKALWESSAELVQHAEEIEGLKKWINEFNDSNQDLENKLSLTQGYLATKDKEIERLENGLEEIANPAEYLSLDLNLTKSQMTKHQWARAVLDNTLSWKNGKMVITEQALSQKEPQETLTKCPKCNMYGCQCKVVTSDDMTKQVNQSFEDYNNGT